MFEALLCHSHADTELAKTIAARLQSTSEVDIGLQVCPSAAGTTVVEAWECGLSSRAILLLLSGDAVPSRLKREDWSLLLAHLERDAEPPVVTILAGSCPYPKLLERRNFYRYRDDPKGSLRAIGRWLLSLDCDGPKFVPADLPWFGGREDELALLWEALVDGAGMVAISNPAPASGKSSLAQKFAWAVGRHFRDILWVDCAERSQTAIAGELAAQAGVSYEGPLAQVLGRLEPLFHEHRLLVVLDDVTGPLPFPGSMESGRTSVLITTGCDGKHLPDHVQVLTIDSVETPVRNAVMEGVEQRLWQAMSVCRPGGFPLTLAAKIANLDDSVALSACNRLVAQRWADPFDLERNWFRVGAGSRQERQDENLQRRHAEELNVIFSQWWKLPDHCGTLIGEVATAFRWSLQSDWRLAASLGEKAFAYLKSKGRRQEAAEQCRQLADGAREWQDERVAETCAWELSWLQDEGGEVRSRPAAAEQLAFDFRLPAFH